MAVREGQSGRRAAQEANQPRRASGKSAARAPDAPRASGSRAKPVARQDEADATAKLAKSRPSLFALIALALLVALLGVGVASYFAANTLDVAVRAAARRGAETPSALGATVCSDFLHQNYTDLIGRIDPSAAPPAATSAFDASATLSHLRAIDQRDGPVSSCSVTRLDASQVNPENGPDGATRLLLVMWRVGDPIASVLITRQDPDRAWLVERDSGFLLAN